MTAGNGLSEVKMALMVFTLHLAWHRRSWLIWNGWNYNRGSGVARIYGATRPHQPPRGYTASVLARGVTDRSPTPNMGGQSQSGIFCQVNWRFGIHFTFINNLGRNFLAKYEGAQRWPLERVPMPQTARNSQWEEHFLGKLNINITLMLLITMLAVTNIWPHCVKTMGSAQLNLVNLVSICVSLEEFLLNHVETIKILVFVDVLVFTKM